MIDDGDWTLASCGRWGYRVPTGKIKARNMPEDLRCCLDPITGGQEPIRLRGEKLFYVVWSWVGPRDWPKATEFLVCPGDYLFEESDGGISLARNWESVKSGNDTVHVKRGRVNSLRDDLIEQWAMLGADTASTNGKGAWRTI